jgi:hypothetical protein
VFDFVKAIGSVTAGSVKAAIEIPVTVIATTTTTTATTVTFALILQQATKNLLLRQPALVFQDLFAALD